jgi:hypothetical protein
MSQPTDVILQFDGIDGDPGYDPENDPNDSDKMVLVQKIVARLTEDGQQFKLLTKCGERFWGGGKVPGCYLFAGTFNYLPLDDFIAELNKLEWREPEAFRMFVQEDDDRAFGVWVIRDGALEQALAPYTLD